MFVGVCMCVGLSVLEFFFLSLMCELLCKYHIWRVSRLYLSVLLAAADRADVDNYKVYSQSANLGDAFLHLPPFLSFS